MNVIGRSAGRQEPMGIVISRGSRVEVAPKFLAYVWAPAPDDVAELLDIANTGSKAA